MPLPIVDVFAAFSSLSISAIEYLAAMIIVIDIFIDCLDDYFDMLLSMLSFFFHYFS
jgi:hypothetical protein